MSFLSHSSERFPFSHDLRGKKGKEKLFGRLMKIFNLSEGFHCDISVDNKLFNLEAKLCETFSFDLKILSTTFKIKNLRLTHKKSPLKLSMPISLNLLFSIAIKFKMFTQNL